MLVPACAVDPTTLSLPGHETGVSVAPAVVVDATPAGLEFAPQASTTADPSGATWPVAGPVVDATAVDGVVVIAWPATTVAGVPPIGMPVAVLAAVAWAWPNPLLPMVRALNTLNAYGPAAATSPARIERRIQQGADCRARVGRARALVVDQVGHHEARDRRAKPGDQIVAGVGRCIRCFRW